MMLALFGTGPPSDWKIAKRTVVDDWSRIDRIVENVAGVPANPGGPTDKDYVYTSGIAKRQP